MVKLKFHIILVPHDHTEPKRFLWRIMDYLVVPILGYEVIYCNQANAAFVKRVVYSMFDDFVLVDLVDVQGSSPFCEKLAAQMVLDGWKESPIRQLL